MSLLEQILFVAVVIALLPWAVMLVFFVVALIAATPYEIIDSYKDMIEMFQDLFTCIKKKIKGDSHV